MSFFTALILSQAVQAQIIPQPVATPSQTRARSCRGGEDLYACSANILTACVLKDGKLRMSCSGGSVDLKDYQVVVPVEDKQLQEKGIDIKTFCEVASKLSKDKFRTRAITCPPPRQKIDDFMVWLENKGNLGHACDHAQSIDGGKGASYKAMNCAENHTRSGTGASGSGAR